MTGSGWSGLAVIITVPVTTRYQKLKETAAAHCPGNSFKFIETHDKVSHPVINSFLQMSTRITQTQQPLSPDLRPLEDIIFLPSGKNYSQ